MNIQDQLAAKMLMCSRALKDLLNEIAALETNNTMSVEEKYARIKNIRQELAKISVEIDSIKNEIKLRDHYSIN